MIGDNLLKVMILVTKYFSNFVIEKFQCGAKKCGSHLFSPLDISVMKYLIKKCVGTKVFRHQIFS